MRKNNPCGDAKSSREQIWLHDTSVTQCQVYREDHFYSAGIGIQVCEATNAP
jgi:hypothetical protein